MRTKRSWLVLVMVFFLSGCIDSGIINSSKPKPTPLEQDHVKFDELREEVQELKASIIHLQNNISALEKHPDMSKFLTSPHEELLKFYLLADTVEEKLNYILHANKLEKVIKDYYKYGLPKFEPQDINITTKQNIDNWYILTATTTTNGRIFESDFYLCATERGLFVDWAASTGYNFNPTIDNFTSSKTDEPAIFRMLLTLADSYIYEFSPSEFEYPKFKEEYYFSIADDNAWYNNGYPLYVKRNSEVGTELLELLKDGNKHRVTVQVRRITDHCYIIDKLISPNWYDLNHIVQEEDTQELET